jgi:hypothetical protein
VPLGHSIRSILDSVQIPTRSMFCSHLFRRYADWIEITDHENERTYCYPIQRWLDKAEDDKRTNVYFSQVSDVPCKASSATTADSTRRSGTTVRGTATTMAGSSMSSQVPALPLRNAYHVKTKTGRKGFLGLSPTGKNRPSTDWWFKVTLSS